MELSVRGEVPVEAIIYSTRETIITGNADYALGYNPSFPVDINDFESVLVVVETKQDIGEEQRSPLAQALAYMVGARRKRMNMERIVHTIYGMVRINLEIFASEQE